ncbi:uncharacterized protein I303_103126 [Kwoniella dejecticola CBS 10117]|uniref:Uncharacterized protein n=1 Tax=Kwoniella dejecticola CBS 10117 TaxID=1296121 RepID=A0A1A6AAM9_9TREE|nr:uncharacterized protein I303_03146 [Kwoniella dejecticola CBS 10117]OBR87122.1 hypothetical protein I303_03146 [Kwoniella dejecticola CBS 10117]
MFHSTKRTLSILFRTPLIPPPQGPAAVELSTFTPSTAGPSRLGMRSRTISNLSIRSGRSGFESAPGIGGTRGYASDKGQKELYSDEAGSTGAGTDDVAHTDAAFNKDPNPASAAQQVENESGKDFTNRSSANPEYSHSPGKQGEKGSETPLNTSKEEVKK